MAIEQQFKNLMTIKTKKDCPDRITITAENGDILEFDKISDNQYTSTSGDIRYSSMSQAVRLNRDAKDSETLKLKYKGRDDIVITGVKSKRAGGCLEDNLFKTCSNCSTPC